MPLPIPIYHQIQDRQSKGSAIAPDNIAPENWPYTLDKDVFEAQVQWIAAQRMCTVTIEDLVVGLSRDLSMAATPARPICLTFDDGSISDYEIVYPILCSYGMRGTFFVITDLIGERGYVNWSHLREMVAHNMSIQSHSCSHASLGDLPLRQVRDELRRSKERVEQALGRRAVAFAAPGGSWRVQLSGLAQECGYQIVCTSQQGVNSEPFDLLALKRLSIRRAYLPDRFQSLVMGQGSGLLKQRIEGFCFDTAKRLLGLDRYNKIRHHLLERASSRARRVSGS
ncbi:polysaccharide deacetylase family protein [Nitrospira sp. Nam74]